MVVGHYQMAMCASLDQSSTLHTSLHVVIISLVSANAPGLVFVLGQVAYGVRWQIWTLQQRGQK